MSVGALTFDRLNRFTESGAPLVSITISQSQGSTPRKEGTAMLVSPWSNEGTIGGGQLEFEAIAIARRILADHRPGENERWFRDHRAFPLGPNLGQCCGGHVSLLFELWGAPEKNWLARALAVTETSKTLLVRSIAAGTPALLLDARDQSPDLPLPLVRSAKHMLGGTTPVGPLFHKGSDERLSFLLSPLQPNPVPLYLYGAGHVGQALVHVLKDTDFQVHWVDLEDSRFPASLPDYVTKIVARKPELIAAHAPAEAWHLIMTRSHALDLEICHALLRGENFSYLGMIGSRTKAVRFNKKLAQLGVPVNGLNRLHCPIGLAGKTSSAPSAIALSVAADFMLRLESVAKTEPDEGSVYHE